MLYDGREYRPNRHLGWRKAQDHAFVDDGEEDVYADGGFTTEKGQPIEFNYTVMFRIKDAKVNEIDGQHYYDQSSVHPRDCVPICAHTATNVALGMPKVKKAGCGNVTLNVGRHQGEIISDGQEYVEQAHYLVQDGRVYQWTSRRMAKAEDKAA